MNTNLVVVAGHLTRDPELKALPSGSSVTSFSIATNRRFKDRDGNQQENTEFHNIVVFGAQAEACAKYLVKGQVASVIGRLQTRNWDKDGVKHYRTEIVANNVEFGAKPAGSSTQKPNDEVQYDEPSDEPADDIF